ncbi:MAG: serine/threonine protein kinase, partial [Myxococcota bacterium]
ERYSVEERIGSGGMGEVYRAMHLGLDRPVAIKVLAHPSTDPGHEERLRERFRREAVALSRLTHPNTVQVIDYGWTDEQRPYIVTEFLDGQGLHEVMAADGRFGAVRAIGILRQICFSLAEAHQFGIVHRDLKPSNVMLVKTFGVDDCVKLIDFGVARLETEDVGKRQLTEQGTTLGTPEYMAPEQARGQTPTPATDVYALGCMFYEMLAGHPPFRGDTALKTMIAQIRSEPPPLGDLVPLAIRQIVSQCMTKDAAGRPVDAGTLSEQLGRALVELQAPARIPEAPVRERPTPYEPVSEVRPRRPLRLNRRARKSRTDEPKTATSERTQAFQKDAPGSETASSPQATPADVESELPDHAAVPTSQPESPGLAHDLIVATALPDATPDLSVSHAEPVTPIPPSPSAAERRSADRRQATDRPASPPTADTVDAERTIIDFRPPDAAQFEATRAQMQQDEAARNAKPLDAPPTATPTQSSAISVTVRRPQAATRVDAIAPRTPLSQRPKPGDPKQQPAKRQRRSNVPYVVVTAVALVGSAVAAWWIWFR